MHVCVVIVYCTDVLLRGIMVNMLLEVINEFIFFVFWGQDRSC
jgi:hypothetical protein